MKAFPRTQVGGMSVSRMIMGTNWLLGWSHKTPSADAGITSKYSTPEAFYPVFEAYLSYGIDCLMAPATNNQLLMDAIKYAEDKSGKKIIIIDTPAINTEDSADARKEAQEVIKHSARMGATFFLPHHSSIEKLVDRQKNIIHRLDDYTSMIRDAGMIPGLSAHMPELVVFSDENEYDVETYIQIYNCMGFLMQVEIEAIAGIINNAKKPVMTIKPMAAGRITPYVGLTFNWHTIRNNDMIAVGAASAAEVHENVEISLAAFENRFPRLGRRASPNNNQAAFGR